MEVGFSLIKKDYIFASDCNYEDTSNLQIRCPFCFEPLFLKSGSINKDHFSHYSESLNSSECELRAKTYYSSYSEFESETKGQTLLKHYRMFSQLYAFYMGVPEDITFFSNLQYDLINQTINIIVHGTTDLEIELQRENMKDFLSLSLKIFLNSIIIMNLEIPELKKFYELYKESIKEFLDLANNRIFNYNKQGTELLEKNLSQDLLKSQDNNQQLFNQIFENRENVIMILAKRFSIAEIRLMLFGGIIQKNTDILNSIDKFGETLKKQTIKLRKLPNGKIEKHISTKYCKYITDINYFKISLFLGQENIIFYSTKRNFNKMHLLNSNIDFFNRLSRIDLFSTSQKSLFFSYYNWGPISKRNYPFFTKQITDELRKAYFDIYSTEEEKLIRKLKKNKEKLLRKAESENSQKAPAFVIHKRVDKQINKTTICKICKNEIPVYRLKAHLKIEHPKRK